MRGREDATPARRTCSTTKAWIRWGLVVRTRQQLLPRVNQNRTSSPGHLREGGPDQTVQIVSTSPCGLRAAPMPMVATAADRLETMTAAASNSAELRALQRGRATEGARCGSKTPVSRTAQAPLRCPHAELEWKARPKAEQ